MANVVIFSYSNVTWTKEHYFDSFVTGFANALSRCGNDVLNIDLKGFVNDFKTEYICDSNKKYVGESVAAFKPDLIITFNNMLHDTEHIKKLSCPVVLYPADGVDFFWHKHFLRKELDLYWFLDINEYHRKSFMNAFPSLHGERLIHFGYVTDFRRRELEQDINLSFLGSIPNHDTSILHYLRKMHSNELDKIFYEALETFRQHPDRNFPLELSDFKSDLGISLETIAVWLITCKARFELLSELFPHGLKLYGYSSFLDCALYNYEFIKHYNHELCVTQKQAETLYNRSKISLNLPNARAVSGFSWRVPDILASQGVLLSFDSPDLRTLTKKYVTLPMYRSTAEAKELVRLLLADNIWRKDIALACNAMVENQCRFEYYFPNITSSTGVKLMNKRIGKVQILYCKSEENALAFKKKKGGGRIHFGRISKELSKILPYFIAKKILKK